MSWSSPPRAPSHAAPKPRQALSSVSLNSLLPSTTPAKHWTKKRPHAVSPAGATTTTARKNLARATFRGFTPATALGAASLARDLLLNHRNTSKELDVLKAFKKLERRVCADLLPGFVLLEREIATNALVPKTDVSFRTNVDVRARICDLFVKTFEPCIIRLALCLIIHCGGGGGVSPDVEWTIDSYRRIECHDLASGIFKVVLSEPEIAAELDSIESWHQARPSLERNFNRRIVFKAVQFALILDFVCSSPTLAELWPRDLGRSPCCMRLSSEIKSMKRLMFELVPLLFFGEGEITVHLKRCHLTLGREGEGYSQSARDEIDFELSLGDLSSPAASRKSLDLSKSFRDGLYFIGLAQALTGDSKCLPQVLVPADTRVRRIHNVRTAMLCLRRHGYFPSDQELQKLESRIRDIVDEKPGATEQVLWTMLLHSSLNLSRDQIEHEVQLTEHRTNKCDRKASSLVFDVNLQAEEEKGGVEEWLSRWLATVLQACGQLPNFRTQPTEATLMSVFQWYGADFAAWRDRYAGMLRAFQWALGRVEDRRVVFAVVCCAFSWLRRSREERESANVLQAFALERVLGRDLDSNVRRSLSREARRRMRAAVPFTFFAPSQPSPLGRDTATSKRNAKVAGKVVHFAALDSESSVDENSSMAPNTGNVVQTSREPAFDSDDDFSFEPEEENFEEVEPEASLAKEEAAQVDDSLAIDPSKAAEPLEEACEDSFAEHASDAADELEGELFYQEEHPGHEAKEEEHPNYESDQDVQPEEAEQDEIFSTQSNQAVEVETPIESPRASPTTHRNQAPTLSQRSEALFTVDRLRHLRTEKRVNAGEVSLSLKRLLEEVSSESFAAATARREACRTSRVLLAGFRDIPQVARGAKQLHEVSGCTCSSYQELLTHVKFICRALHPESARALEA